MTRFILLPLLVVVVLYGLVGPSPELALGLGVVTVIPGLTAARFEASKPAQAVIGIALFVGTITVLVTLLARNYAAPEVLRTPWAAFTGAALLVAVTRNYFAKPVGGDAGTIGVALCAMAGCGGAQTDLVYPAFVILFIASATLSRRRADTGHAPTTSLTSRSSLARSTAMLGVTGAIAALFITTLPPLHEWAVERILMRMSSRSGFSQRLWLGSLRGMLLSDRKVLRVHGDNVDYLRGIVYSRYLGGRWSRVKDDAPETERPPTVLGDQTQDSTDLVEVRYVDSEPQRYFLPLGARAVGVSSGIALVDRHGVLTPVAAEPAYRIQYTRSGPRAFSVADPDDGDLEVPRGTYRLKRLAYEWTQGAQTPAEAAQAIQDRLLTNYEYSLDFEYENRRDPIVEFLVEKKVGHCEFFASAMAILLRLRGVPTRLVGGYRVTEHNPIGGYYIVRERNAHAWVEVYLPERGWTTYNPTPSSELDAASSSTSVVAGVVDAMGSAWAAFLSWLDRRTWTEVLMAPAAIIVIPLVIRIILRRRARRTELAEDSYAQTLACFEELSTALASHGFVRETSETIEQLAGRVAQHHADELQEGPILLRRYAALRYGGVGRLEELEADIRLFCREHA